MEQEPKKAPRLRRWGTLALLAAMGLYLGCSLAPAPGGAVPASAPAAALLQAPVQTVVSAAGTGTGKTVIPLGKAVGIKLFSDGVLVVGLSSVETAAKLERLQKLLEEADNMADIITIESAISDTELAIEQLTGSLRDYDNRIDYATVTISLREVYRLSNSDVPATTFSQRIADAFAKGCRGFVNFMEALAIFLVTAWIPVLVVVAVVIAIFVIRRRNRAGKRDISHREDSGEKS